MAGVTIHEGVTMQNVRWTMLLAVVAAAVAVVAPLAGASSTAKSCGTVVGAHWRVSGHSGTLYMVGSIGGAPCSVARKLVPKLTKERATGHPAEVLAGPTGWSLCALSGVGSHAGSCDKNHHFGVAFTWTPKG